MFFASLPQLGARTITTPDKVVYEVTSETEHTVRVSLENQSIHRDNASALTIPATVTDPESGTAFTVTEIAPEAFRKCAITAIDIQADIESIHNNTFRECGNLEFLVLPSNIKHIDGCAFMDCPKLKAPYFPESLVFINDWAFCGDFMGEVTLPPSAYIGSYAFADSKIHTLNFPEENKGITFSSRVFHRVSTLRKVVFPKWIEEVSEYLFNECPDLEEVDFSHVESENFSIADFVFLNCKQLTKVTFPAKMNRIGNSAFNNTSITEITLPELKTLGNAAFCSTRIKNITLESWGPSKIENVGTDVFARSSLESIVFPDWMKTIPSSFCDYCSSLTSVTISEGVESIGYNAFRNIPATSISFPSTLKIISQDAFYYAKLNKVNFPEGLETIGQGAFNHCALTEVTIPSSVTSIGIKAFTSNRLTSINLPEASNAGFKPIEFGENVFSDNPMVHFTFPAWMIQIPDGIFMDNLLESVEFAEGTWEIGIRSFANNRRLMIGTFPESIKYFGEESFLRGGSSLTGDDYLCSVVIGNHVTINSSAFQDARLKEVTFTDCDYVLGRDVFENVTTIKKITFPECMTAIPDGICNGWVELTEIVWPPHLESIGDKAFKNCKSYNFGTDADGNGNVLNLSQAPFEELRHIGDESFAGNNITSIVWPENGERLNFGDEVFSGITTLESVHIPGWMDVVPDGLFKNCANLTELIWDESDRTDLVIGNRSFMGIGISEITWPDVPTQLNNASFAYCQKATKIIWPESTTTLGRACFDSCISLTEPTEVPGYVTSIPHEAFRNCLSLPSFTLHDGVTALLPYAFDNCKGLTEFTVEGNVPVLEENILSNCSSLVTVNLSYPVNAINASAFQEDGSLVNFNIPAQGDVKLDKIGYAAFYNCVSLPEFPDIIDGDTEIFDDAFLGDALLRHLTLPSSGLLSTPETYYNRHLKNAETLQAVDFKCATEKDSSFRLHASSFDNAPLLGVSYFTDIIPYAAVSCTPAATTRTEKGILMAGRDMKYRLMENGFGNLWDIREIKNPQLRLFGDIQSEFSPGDTYNRYKAMIRWEIVESDLNDKAPTIYHLHRDGQEIARIEFGIPEIRESVAEGNITRNEPTKVFPIRITRNGVESDKADQYGDFSFEVSENLYTMVYSNQHKNLYFHPETSHRIGLNERMGATSWFLYIDEFNSPDLNQPDVPDSYTYTLTMEGYDYEEPVNNDGYTAGDDALYWHMEPRSLPAVIESEPCVVHTSMTIPSLAFDGVYSLEEIKADTDGALPLSNVVMDTGEVTLAYALANPSHVHHRLQDGNVTKPIIDHITSYEIPSRDFPTAENEWQTVSIKGDTGKAQGEMVVPAEKDPRQGSSFQIVTHTNGRGTFGSRIVTIPGAPDLSISVAPYEHCWGGDDHQHDHVLRAKISIEPQNLDKMNYTALPSESQHSVGVWRELTYGIPGAYDDVIASNQAETVTNAGDLLYHTGDDHFNHSWACADCRQNQVYNTTDGLWSYTDHFSTGNIPAGQWNNVKSDYRVRLYVQTPDDPSKWMIAEARASQNDVVTGVEELTPDAEGNPVYYNLQGVRIASPQPGDVLIRVDRSGSHKIRY